MKKMFLIIGKVILVLVAFLLAYLLLVFAVPYIAVNNEDVEPAEDVEVYIKTNGVHTDIVVPIKTDYKDWSTSIAYSHIKSQDSTMQFIGIGWGDKGFYLNTPEWSDLTFRTAFVAAFGLGGSAMHATFYKEMKEGENCIKIKVSAQEYQALVDYIEQKFQFDVNGKPLLINATTYGQNDSFYEAKGSYNFFYTCNTWANNGLKVMNQKAALWTATDRGIFQHYN
ncbi:TIGR02117 family protein [Flavobacterium tegetincola]|uniref:TIGR02117 family protein n=1 Tax=Flavobacterium tegetincola TaxID=150172 RepID=UPI00047CE259|nr:TIGR02117 family protein [Flavobacterium tegetincola]